MKILVVDDDNSKVVEICKTIGDVGVNSESIEVVTTAASAMKKLKEEQYDLLIVDLVLPKRIGEPPVHDGGTSLVEAIHRSDKVNTPEFIVGLTADEDAKKSSESSFSSLLWSIELTGYDRAEWKLRLQQKIQHLRAREQQRGQVGEPTIECDILFVCALLDPEIAQLHLASGTEWEQVSYSNDPTLYWKSEIALGGGVFQVHSTCLPQMGLVSAATGVSQAVRALKPKLVIMTGICAGRKGDCDLGDIIASSITWDYGSGKFAFSEAEGKVVFEPAPVHVLADASLLTAAKALSSNRESMNSIYLSCPGFRPPAATTLHVGPMASGAAVQNHPEFFDGVANQNRKILGVDMEAFGVAWACHQSIEPHPKWIVIKGVSDFADGSKNNDYQKYSSFVSAKVAFEIAGAVM